MKKNYSKLSIEELEKLKLRRQIELLDLQIKDHKERNWKNFDEKYVNKS